MGVSVCASIRFGWRSHQTTAWGAWEWRNRADGHKCGVMLRVEMNFIRLRISDRLSDWCDWSETGTIFASLPFRPAPCGGVELLTRHLQRVQSAPESLIAIKISHHAAAIWLCFSFCGVAETPAVDVLFIYIWKKFKMLDNHSGGEMIRKGRHWNQTGNLWP